jgi:hypothetical protein
VLTGSWPTGAACRRAGADYVVAAVGGQGASSSHTSYPMSLA